MSFLGVRMHCVMTYLQKALEQDDQLLALKNFILIGQLDMGVIKQTKPFFSAVIAANNSKTGFHVIQS